MVSLAQVGVGTRLCQARVGSRRCLATSTATEHAGVRAAGRASGGPSRVRSAQQRGQRLAGPVRRAARRAATSGPAREHLAADWPAARCGSASPKTRPGRRAVPPWAPTPGASRGPLTAARSSPSSWTAGPTVAPTTRPTLPSSPRSRRAAFSAAAPDDDRRRQRRCRRRVGVLHLRPLRVGGQARTKTPRPVCRGQVERRAQRPEAEVRAHGERRRARSDGCPCRGRRRRRRPWSSRCRRAWRRG